LGIPESQSNPLPEMLETCNIVAASIILELLRSFKLVDGRLPSI
jgi:hypothetical protein